MYVDAEPDLVIRAGPFEPELGQVPGLSSLRPRTRYGLTLEGLASNRGIPKEGPVNWPGAPPVGGKIPGSPTGAKFQARDTGARGFGRYQELLLDQCPSWREGAAAERCWAERASAALYVLHRIAPVTRADFDYLASQATGREAIRNYPPSWLAEFPPPGEPPVTPPVFPPPPGPGPVTPPPIGPVLPPGGALFAGIPWWVALLFPIVLLRRRRVSGRRVRRRR